MRNKSVTLSYNKYCQTILHLQSTTQKTSGKIKTWSRRTHNNYFPTGTTTKCIFILWKYWSLYYKGSWQKQILIVPKLVQNKYTLTWNIGSNYWLLITRNYITIKVNSIIKSKHFILSLNSRTKIATYRVGIIYFGVYNAIYLFSLCLVITIICQ